MTFAKKVFLSYHHDDVDWAKEFNDRLTQDNFSCFWDRASIYAGDDWEKKLLSHLETSQHLVVLLSKKAKASDWVRREYTRFDALINPSKPSPEQANRRLIFVLLDEDDTAFNRGQKITDFNVATPAVYPGPPGNVIGKPLWDGVINQIENALRADEKTIPVALAVLALTRQDFEGAYNTNYKNFATKVNLALSAIGIDAADAVAVAAFKDRYGKTASDWKPLGGSAKVSEMLEGVMTSLNNDIDNEGKPFRWEPIGEKFYGENQVEITNELKKLNESPSVFVLDPISLYDPSMVVRLGLLTEYFESDRTVFLALPPVIPHPYGELIEMVKNSANSFFNYFYASKLRRRYANCCANVCDERDIGRMLRTTLGPQVYVAQQRVIETTLG